MSNTAFPKFKGSNDIICLRICSYLLKTRWPSVVNASDRVRSPYPLEVPDSACDFEEEIGEALITTKALLLYRPGQACGLLESIF